SQVDGDHASVTLHAAGTTDSSTWSLDGGCFAVKAKPGSDQLETFTYCNLVPDAYFLSGVVPLGLFPFEALQPDSRVSVVQEDGRWFVSPADTVLDVANAWIDRLDQHSLSQLLGLPELVPPTGTLELGTPVTLNDGEVRSLS